MDYQSFLATKAIKAKSLGIECIPSDIHSSLYGFQNHLVRWAVAKGRSAIFADCGLGKTFMQLEWARLIGCKVLIIAPLAVAHQTRDESAKLDHPIQYVRRQKDITHDVVITNYEMIDNLDPASFNGVVLDESSILKSVDGKTRTKLITAFNKTPYRLCCTATPAPNDVAEFANHAEFLGIMTRQEMLASFFVHDDGGWRLKGHAQDAFYRWMASWAMMVRMPSDIGYPDDGYILPDLDVEQCIIDGDAAKVAAQIGQLFTLGLSGIEGRFAARKNSVDDRVQHGAEIIRASNEQWIVWCGLNDEGNKIHAILPDSVSIEGADSLDSKILKLGQFLDGSKRVLITKVKIAGFGMNFQHCHNMMFLGLSDSYESWYQAIRRCWRFGQAHPVNVKVVLSDLELPILDNVMRKEQEHNMISREVSQHAQNIQMEELGIAKADDEEYLTSDAEGEDWKLMLGDSVERLAELEDSSIDFSVFSPPFLSLYVYSDSTRDIGNNSNDADFYSHFGFVMDHLYRVIKPGRICAVHVAQVGTTLAHDGMIGIKDFRGGVIQGFIDRGFVYSGDVTIDKNPQAQAIRTHAKALLFKQLRKDASWLRPGLADYILIFRKPGDNEVPIIPDISNEDWITWAHPVWYDIRESDTLNVHEARGDKDGRHMCPLQLPVIERCIRLWTNKGETVLSPFAGIGSEGYESLRHGRKFVGVELKPEYFNVAVRNLKSAAQIKTQGRLL